MYDGKKRWNCCTCLHLDRKYGARAGTRAHSVAGRCPPLSTACACVRCTIGPTGRRNRDSASSSTWKMVFTKPDFLSVSMIVILFIHCVFFSGSTFKDLILKRPSHACGFLTWYSRNIFLNISVHTRVHTSANNHHHASNTLSTKPYHQFKYCLPMRSNDDAYRHSSDSVGL